MMKTFISIGMMAALSPMASGWAILLKEAELQPIANQDAEVAKVVAGENPRHGIGFGQAEDGSKELGVTVFTKFPEFELEKLKVAGE